MNRHILGTVAALMITTGVMAQNGTVSGNVSDNMGPIIGATVKIAGTSNMAVTDMDGNFKLNNVKNADKAVLQVSYVGMEDFKEPLKGRTSGINIVMKESMGQLNEVVVVGYGTQKRVNLTGAVASVAGKNLEKVPTASVGEALVGRLPGVQITTADGSPDAEQTIRVRGGGSITQDNNPLIIVDGFEVSSLNDIPPTDVESIDVLKDAASTAIYGARGANGVVLVTTKRPSEGKLTINVNSYIQTKELSNKLDVMDPYEYVMMQYEYARQKSSNPTAFFNKYGKASEYYIYQGDAGYDWQDEIFGSHPVSNYTDVSVSGGNDKVKYKLAFIHQDQPSVMQGNGLRQNNINGQLNVKLLKFLDLEYRTRYMNKTVNGAGTDGVSLLSALRQAPTEGLDDYMNTPTNNEYFDSSTLSEVTRFNPIEENEMNYKKRKNKFLNTQVALTWKIAKGLTLRNEFGYEENTQTIQRYYGKGTSNYKSNGNLPMVTQSESDGKKWQVTNVLNYNFSLGKHDIQAMLGQEIKSSESKSRTFSTRYFPEGTTSSQAFDNLALGTPYENSSSYGSPTRISSFFGRVNYAYDDRYLATFTLRADGSSKFSKNNRWGVFPAVAVAWRASQEKFLKDVKWLSNLKLRLSWGESGNDRISANLYNSLYGISSSRPAGWGEESRFYYKFYNTTYPVNPNVKWETTVTRNLGLDFGLFHERLSGTVEVYWNTVKDLLVPSDIPGYSGFTKMMTNVGQTSNKGIELSLNAYIIEKKDFTLSANFNIGHNKNKIDKLASGETEWILQSGLKNLSNEDDYRAYVGGSTGLIYGYVNDGFYKVEDFDYFDDKSRTWHLKDGVVDCSILSGTPRPGNAKFKKLTDDGTNVLTSSDRTVLGNTTPKFSGGFGLNATWKGFDASVFFSYMCGFDVYNYNKIVLTSWVNNTYNNFSTEVGLDKRWRNFDDMGNEIRYNPEVLAEFNKNATMWNPTSLTSAVTMSYAVEDGSFLRLNNLTLGYSLPKNWMKAIGFQKCRFYVTGYNLFTITGYSGYDPEVDIATGLTPNIDNNRYPRSRTYTFGVQLTL